MTMSSWSPDAWSAAADWVTALAAGAASIAAIRGINSWRRQELWREERELARGLLVALVGYEQSIKALRSRLVRNHEMRGEEGETDTPKRLENRAADVRRAYSRRWNKVDAARAEIEAKLPEAKIVWSDEKLDTLFSGLFKLEGELLHALTMHLDLNEQIEEETDPRSRREMIVQQREYKHVLFGDLSADGFGESIRERIRDIHKYLQPKPGRQT